MAQFRWRLKAKYGITVEDYEQMLEEQQGVCAICRCAPSGRFRRLSVDHDHKTGKVRGLLCDPCNRILGMVQDRVEHLDSFVAYLENDR